MNARRAVATAAVVAMCASASAQQPGVWAFDELSPGRAPAGFVFTGAASDQAGLWTVVRDGANGVLAHAQEGRPGTELAVVDGTSLANLRVSVRLRFPAASGSAGLVWRYHDASNYYAAALDLRSQVVRLYRVVGGNRTRLEEEGDLELDPGAWHTMKIEHAGMRMRIWLDGVPVADGRDRTPPEPGAIGVWTAGDAAVWIDDLRTEPIGDAARPRRRE